MLGRGWWWLAHVSGSALNSSASSRSSSASVLLAWLASEGEGGPSHDWIRRWLRARATFARLNMTSASLGSFDMLDVIEVTFTAKSLPLLRELIAEGAIVF